ncbi:DUF4124 domain-containing protein [Xanthomonas sp. 3793]|uniref:DUF4124 domain-containing protein n=1 Tax=Xanthomonas sp. 3793 TaxID=3035312 RepID=UPI002DD6680B|nr:DUF4124 domain-containing protein [Xanthomonas sp. 3793]
MQFVCASIAGWIGLRRKKKCMRHRSASAVRPLGAVIGNVPVFRRSKPLGNKPPGALYPSSPPKNRTRAPRDTALLPAIGKLCRLGGGIMKRSLAIAMYMLTLPAAAQSAYKCSDAKLGTVYQSTPCADGAEQKRWTKQAVPAPTATAAQAGPQTASTTARSQTWAYA